MESIIEEINNKEYYNKFLKKINKLYFFLRELTKEYIEKISKCHKEEIEKYSINSIEKDDYLINIEFRLPQDFWLFSGVETGILSSVILIITFSHEISFFALGFSTIFGLLGGITISGLLLLLEFGDFHIRKFFEKREREKKIKRQFNNYFDKLDSYKKKLLSETE